MAAVAALLLALGGPGGAAEAADSSGWIETLVPESGSTNRELYSIEVHFTVPVQGVTAEDLLINDVPATNVVQGVPGQFVFSFPQPEDGTVTVAWRADHGITDLSDPPRPFPGGTWTYVLDALGPAPGVFISEFMAENRMALTDEDRDTSDWIEIYNSETTPADLGGWYLTDDQTNLTKWQFPDVTLSPKSYLVVFASAKNKVKPTARLHTNFKLASSGGYLALVSPATNVISEFVLYPAQTADISYGRVEGEPQVVGYFTRPTPGTVNAISGTGFAPEVQFSRAGGPFLTNFDLVLSAANTNITIRYTLDGTMPTNSSPVYTAPITVVNSVQIRTRAFADGLLPGPPRSETFLLLNSNVTNFSSDLPVMVIHSLGKGAPTASRLNFAHVSVYEPGSGRTSLTNPPALSFRAGLQIRGSSTEGITKASYKLEAWDELNLDRDVPLLGLPADSDWVLYAPNQFEPVLIHNPFVHQLSRDMGRYSPRTRFLEVYINKSTGPIAATHYVGIYVLEEKIKIAPQRVAIDRLQPEDVAAREVTGGYLMKIDRVDPGDSGLYTGGATMAYVDPKERAIKVVQRRPQLTYVSNYFKTFYTTLVGSKWRDPVVGYRSYIDVDSWIDFHVLEMLSGNVDTLVLSTYFHKPRGGKILFGPHWDFDRALGSTDGRDSNPRNWVPGPFFGAAWWSRLFSDIDFWQRWVDRWQELRTTHFALTNLHALIDRQANEVRQAQPREHQKWRFTLRGGSYQSEINLMKNWVSNRIDFIDKQLTQPPALSSPGGPIQPGFQVVITGAAKSSVYYTLDGSDPRASLGPLSSQAQLYTGPITLTRNARVVARAQDSTKRQTGGPPTSTPWSRPVAATYVVTTPLLLITEIMFHPEKPSGATTNTTSDFEFVELMNAGTDDMALPGCRIQGGIDFTFLTSAAVTTLHPGERVVVAKNLTAFHLRYPQVTNVVGEFAGSLGNQSNRLVLTGPLQEPIVDFIYQDNWVPLADGFGFSLVLADETIPAGQIGKSDAWRLSAALGGSPGFLDPSPPVLPAVYVNEIVSNPKSSGEDAIELLNESWSPVDISGWWLTDNFHQPKKFQIPVGSVIQGKGVLVFRESQFRRSGTNAFGLDALGESTYLFSADSQGKLTGWCHGFDFGPQEGGMSFGRWVTSDGHEHLAPYREPTLGHANSVPETWPAAFNEIMYAPALENGQGQRGQFIELADLSASEPPLALFDASDPIRTWRIRGSIEFDFPAGFRFPPSRFVVLVGFDPAADPGALLAFRALYRLDSTCIILGPWRGTLGETNGTLTLLRPLAASSLNTNSLPYTLVEELNYRADAPWPTDARATARSICPSFPRFFGDEPRLWLSLPPTPGDSDSDADGLPDQWELAHGLNPYSAWGDDGAAGDPDQDDFTNLQEYLVGTDPMNAHSLPHVEIGLDGLGSAQLSVRLGPSRNATIQYRTDLTTGGWQPLKTVLAPVDGGNIVLLDPCTNAARLYRLQVP